MKEISSENLTELDKRYRTTVLIVLGQVFAVLAMIFAGLVFGPKIPSNLGERDFTTIWVGVLFIAIGSFILRRMFFNWERLKNIAILKGTDGVLNTLRRNSIILGIFAVIVGILGFVISALSGNVFDLIRAGLIAFVVFAINFPRRKVWKTIVSNLEKV